MTRLTEQLLERIRDEDPVVLGTHEGVIEAYREMVHEIGNARKALTDAIGHFEFIRKEARKEGNTASLPHIGDLCDRAIEILQAEMADENEKQAGIPTI